MLEEGRIGVEDKAAGQIQETVLHGDCGRLPLLFTWVLMKALHAGQGCQGPPIKSRPACLRHPGLCRGGSPPHAVRVSRLPTGHLGAELGWEWHGGMYRSCDLAPRPIQARLLSPTRCGSPVC